MKMFHFAGKVEKLHSSSLSEELNLKVKHTVTTAASVMKKNFNKVVYNCHFIQVSEFLKKHYFTFFCFVLFSVFL